MLETEIKKLTEAVIANTAARTGQAAAAPRSATAAGAEDVPAQASPAAAAPVVDVLSEGAAALAATPVAAAVAAPAVAIPQAGQPAVPAAAAVFTKEQVIKAVIKMAKLCGREAATTMMATFGAKKASELNDAAQYPAVMATIDAALPPADII